MSRFDWRSFLGCVASAALLLSVTGCGTQEPKPITASSSKYQVDDGKSGPASNTGDPADPSKTGASTGSAKPAPGAPNGAGQPAGNGPDLGGPDLAPPRSTPDAVALAAGGVSYAVPKDAKPEELLAFIQKLQRAFQSEGPRGNSLQEQLADLQKMMKSIETAADMILHAEADAGLRVVAAHAKVFSIQALQLNEIPGAKERLADVLAAFAKDKSPEIARVGRLKSFELRLEPIESSDTEGADALQAELNKILGEQELDEEVFAAAYRAASVLDDGGFAKQATAAYAAIVAAFKDSKDEQLKAQVGKLAEVIQISSLDLRGKFEALSKGKDGAVEQIVTAVKTLFAAPERGETILRVCLELGDAMETLDHYAAAREIYAGVIAGFKDHANKNLAEAATQQAQYGEKRMALIGQPWNLVGHTVAGEAFDWSKYKGKVVLVDFWATWCGPCLAEIPNMRRNLNQLKDKGFDIVGINLDVDSQRLPNFLGQQKLPWESCVLKEMEAGLDRFGHPWFEKFGITGIPFMLLLDRDGNVAALNTRGEKFDKKVAELLAKADGESKPADTKPADTKADSEKKPEPEKKPAAESQSRNRLPAPDALDDFGPLYFVAAPADEDAGKKDADKNNKAAEEEANPYLAPKNATIDELVDFLQSMQEKPTVIQQRPGFGAAVADASDRVLAGNATEKQQLIAALTKIDILHRRAVLGDNEADEQLRQLAERFKDDARPKLAREIKFLRVERSAMDASEAALEKLPTLLDELKAYVTAEKLTEKHRRLASSTVKLINRLEDDDLREKLFVEFGKLFAKASDRRLAKYGANLAETDGPGSDLVGKPLELAGTTTADKPFDWKSYRGKVVLVAFWATWCGPCRREIPQIKALYERLGTKAFDVVGVSVDKDPDAVVDVEKEEAIPWTNLVGDDVQEMAEQLGVHALPTLFVVDKQGIVVATDHHLPSLIKQIEKLAAEEKK